MSDTTQTNAMAEIALALAMGFFSIMVLAMVSMGSGLVPQTAATKANFKEAPVTLAQTSPQADQQEQGSGQAVEPDQLIIFFKGAYYDSQLQALRPVDIQGGEKMILAVSPDLSMSQTLSARKGLSMSDMTVVVLDDDWLNAIGEAGL